MYFLKFMPQSEKKEFPLLIEEIHWAKGYRNIAGIDEVGRGSLAGPVFACAVIFDPYYFDARIKDSKKLTATARKELNKIIQCASRDWSMGIASAEEIDRMNILRATALAMRRALNALKQKPDLVIVDGNMLPESGFEEIAVIDGDEKSFTVSAASVIAKVGRDHFMSRLGKLFPHYRFDKNKGYGTAEHIQQIQKFGPCRQHRMSFLGRIIHPVLKAEHRTNKHFN